MRRTNRIEPINIDARSLAHAIMITTTELEIVRQVEVTPITESFVNCIRSRTITPIKPSRKILWCIGCLFFTAGILALSIMITGFTIIFRRMNTIKKSNIERYDLGDLHYRINNINQPSNTYLSNINKAFIQNYLSNQLITEPGYRGLIIDEIFVQNKPHINKRKQRETTCPILFLIQNTQVYFDHCSTCIPKRNLILRRLFFNRTAFREPFYLLLNSQYSFVQICSTPNISHLFVPKQLALSDVEKINTNLLSIFSQTVSAISNVISIETTSVDNLDESTSVSTDQFSTITNLPSIQTQEISRLNTQTTTSSRRTPADIFQFLPFRPSKTIFPWQSIRH